MQRYQGQSLSQAPTISVIVNDSLGNFVAGTSLVLALRATYPEAKIALWSGDRVTEMGMALTTIEQFVPFQGSSFREGMMVALGCPSDLVINMERDPWARSLATVLAGDQGSVVGAALAENGRGELGLPEGERGELWIDQNWIAADLLAKYQGLKGPHIVDIFSYLAHLPVGFQPYQLPSAAPGIAVPDILISTAASLPEKLWPTAHWIAWVKTMQSRGLSVGILGAKPSDQAKFWKGAGEEEILIEATGILDLRGRLSLPQVVGALSEAQLIFTMDNGVLHLACGTQTPIIGLFRHGFHRLWGPPVSNLLALEPGPGRRPADITLAEAIAAVDGFQRSLFPVQ